MCLLIGSSGVGKTLLLKRLQNYPTKVTTETEIAPMTIPTVGTNLTTVTLGRRDEITLRELGGSMVPIWHNYFKDAGAIIYMVDLTNRFQIAASCIQLLMVLSHADTQGLPVLLILNKTDLPTVMNHGELESLFRLQDILTHCPKMSVLEMSAKTGHGLDLIAKWILQHHKPAPPPSQAPTE
ncbi:ADP-ribosylation factor-like protein 16 [Haliotis asinina]|uniref:ADP-ribosylation factor-like protein 16 n=1 Tax=Haliotis asinina TaxID=109174 RepID=UPI003531F51E